MKLAAPKSVRVKALIALAMVCFFWGTTWVASRQGVQYMPVFQLAGIRQSIGGLLYVLFFTIKGATYPKGKEWIPIIILSLLNFFLSNGLSTWGVKYITGGLGAIIAAIFPLWIVIINLLFKKSIINAVTFTGLLLGFAGVCIIFYDHLLDFLNPHFRFGIIVSLFASLSWAFGTLYTKSQAANFNPYFSLGFQMLFSGLTTSLIAYTTKQTVPLNEIPWQAWTSIAYLVVFGSVLAYMAYLYALQNLSTEQASIYAYMNPVIAMLVGALLFQEKLTIYIGIGGLVTLAGVRLINIGSKRDSKKQPAYEPE
ncbi:DMT family transporter [Gynurincola endophyticus]|uniref:DMT family transporter n=1 Tax=Gynurincola endophyticus TaxID=2479004 RepID=UPI000F8C929B|nr:EamA family transporter [Gynurincola endophyticus]